MENSKDNNKSIKENYVKGEDKELSNLDKIKKVLDSLEDDFDREFNVVIGYDHIKKELKRIIDIMQNPEKYKKLGVKEPVGVLLEGCPGIGKTLMANCFIKASKRKYFICRKDKPDGDFVKEIKKVYEDAKQNAPSIVFLDDMDKFANEDDRHRNAEEYVTIQSCIDETKNCGVFTFATINEIINLPKSLLRSGRFDKIYSLNNPTGEDAIKIVKYFLSQKKMVSDIDAKEITQLLDGRSCAELEAIINEAGIFAGFENKEKIDMNDIIRAYTSVCLHVSEEICATQKESVRIVAYHEAGHAVVGEILEPESVTLLTVRKCHGRIEGSTSYWQDENYFSSKRFMENRVTSLLAGKAASEITSGCIDTGSSSDIERVFGIIERFIDDFCLFGFNCFKFRNTSNQTLFQRETAMYNEVERYYQIAKKILINNREFLDKLANALANRKVVLPSEIQEIKKTCKIVPYSF